MNTLSRVMNIFILTLVNCERPVQSEPVQLVFVVQQCWILRMWSQYLVRTLSNKLEVFFIALWQYFNMAVNRQSLTYFSVVVAV